MNKLLIITLSVLLLSSCGLGKKKRNEESPVAKVGAKTLYLSDVSNLVQKGTSPEDSVTIVRSYIEKWIRTQLLIEKAQLNLTTEEKDVEREIEEYRNSLLIYRYEQQLISQKLDTTVSENEIEQYYTEFSKNFRLDDAIVKAVFIKVPVQAPRIDQVSRWLQSDKEQDIRELESYCFQYASIYDYFNEDWTYFGNISKQLPMEIKDRNQFLESNRYIETQDTAFRYFVHIKDVQKAGTVPPLDFIKTDLKTIVINKRKLKFLSDVENNIYFDALNKNNFKIY